MDVKKCYHCGETKPVEEFAKNRSRKDGRQTECRVCRKEVSRKWREMNPGKNLEYVLRWEARNPEKKKASNRRQYLKNREQNIIKARAYYLANKDKIAERRRLRRQQKDQQNG